MQVKELKEFLEGVRDDVVVLFVHKNGEAIVGGISYHVDDVRAVYQKKHSNEIQAPGALIISSQDPVIFRSMKLEDF